VRRVALALLLIACSGRSPRGPVALPAPNLDADRVIRVALAVPSPTLSATRGFVWYQADGTTSLAQGAQNEQWRLEQGTSATIRAVSLKGSATPWQRQLVLRTAPSGFVTVNGRRYRGDLLVAGDSAPVIVNRLTLEDYLRSVVTAEMGPRSVSDSSALQAQAIASRSYAAFRLGSSGEFDLRATVADQVYRGFDGENANASAAVDATRGLVLLHDGRVVNASFFSTCGGSTAEPNEVWRSPAVAYLRRVSDRIGREDRYYCDGAPRFRWTRTLTTSELNAALEQYLRSYASVPAGGPGTVRHVAVERQTPSGRVGTLELETDRGAFALHGNDIRSVIRTPGGEILPSTYFSVEPEYGRDGLIRRVTFRGRGNGHGVGMCQWGAIGRARAGQSSRQILGTYYPGTTIGPVPVQ
jgi:stage II sporulation protein D